MPRRNLLFILIPLILLISGGLIFALATQPSDKNGGAGLVQVRVPQGSSGADQTLQITKFNYHYTNNRLADVIIGVKNVTQTTQDGLVWYILAPVGSIEPWREILFSGPERQITLEAGVSEDFQFIPPATIPEGDYDLSVWVHGIRDGERFHSDGAGAERGIFISEPFALMVTDLGQVEQIDGSIALEITLDATNHSGETTEVELLFTVIAAEEVENADAGAEYTSPTFNTVLYDDESATTTLRGAVRLSPGTYNVIGWIRQRDTNAPLSRVVSPTVINIE